MNTPISNEPVPPLRAEEQAAIEKRVIEALRTVFDPEIPVNLFDLGLIYGIDVTASDTVRIRMSLTSVGCPVAATLPGEVKAAVEARAGLKNVSVDLVWDPPWSPDRMSDAAKLELGLI